MRKILFVLIASLLATTALAQSRVAVINSARLLTESPQYKAAGESMKKEFQSRADALEKEARALAEDMAKFKKDAEIMSSTERAKREKDLNTRRIDISYSERKLKEDVAGRERELTQSLMKQFQDVIESVAKENKYDIVLQDPVYAIDSADITDTVLNRLKKK
ncbi:MAG: OmpH family outer membrane protein [Oceanococcaceae bacterium]